MNFPADSVTSEDGSVQEEENIKTSLSTENHPGPKSFISSKKPSFTVLDPSKHKRIPNQIPQVMRHMVTDESGAKTNSGLISVVNPVSANDFDSHLDLLMKKETSKDDERRSPEKLLEQIVQTFEPNTESLDDFQHLDVLVCGKCQCVFNTILEFENHKESDCNGKESNQDLDYSSDHAIAMVLWCNSVRRKLLLLLQNHSQDDENMGRKIQRKWFCLSPKLKGVWLRAAGSLKVLGRDGKIVFGQKENYPKKPTTFCFDCGKKISSVYYSKTRGKSLVEENDEFWNDKEEHNIDIDNQKCNSSKSCQTEMDELEDILFLKNHRYCVSIRHKDHLVWKKRSDLPNDLLRKFEGEIEIDQGPSENVEVVKLGLKDGPKTLLEAAQQMKNLHFEIRRKKIQREVSLTESNSSNNKRRRLDNLNEKGVPNHIAKILPQGYEMFRDVDSKGTVEFKIRKQEKSDLVISLLPNLKPFVQRKVPKNDLDSSLGRSREPPPPPQPLGHVKLIYKSDTEVTAMKIQDEGTEKLSHYQQPEEQVDNVKNDFYLDPSTGMFLDHQGNQISATGLESNFNCETVAVGIKEFETDFEIPKSTATLPATILTGQQTLFSNPQIPNNILQSPIKKLQANPPNYQYIAGIENVPNLTVPTSNDNSFKPVSEQQDQQQHQFDISLTGNDLQSLPNEANDSPSKQDKVLVVMPNGQYVLADINNSELKKDQQRLM